MKYRHPVTPAEISGSIEKLCRLAVTSPDKPQYVKCEPIDGEEARDCFPIVDKQVAEFGGRALLGWCIWELPGAFVEAEFHAVWQSEDGSLLDISPKVEPTENILFLPDPSSTYEGMQVNNVRLALQERAEILGFIAACNREFEFMNRGDRIGVHGEIELVGADAAEYQAIAMEKAKYQTMMFGLVQEISPYGPCPCGSGKKNKWCHKV